MDKQRLQAIAQEFGTPSFVFDESALAARMGFFARAICHELDHLDGILYIDKATHIQKA